MDLFALYNSLRIAFLSTIITFFLGMFFAYYVSKMNRLLKGIFDVIFLLALVLPPTVIGYFLLLILGPQNFLGKFFLDVFGIRLTMVWTASVAASVVVSFPLMYRTMRASFESFDETLADSARCLGASNTRIFWTIRTHYCKKGLIAGAILAFARSLGEYGATTMVSGFIPGKTQTISTTVYQLWQTGNDRLAMQWVGVNILIAIVVLVVLNLIENKKSY